MKISFRTEKVDLEGDARKAFRKDARWAMRMSVNILIVNVKRQLEKRTGSSKPAPEGQPPAKHSGTLYKSLRRLPLKIGDYKISGGIYTDFPGAGRLEWGFTDADGIRTFPHPFLEPASKESEGPISNVLEGLMTDV